jgi:hypothetical protein
MQNNSMKHEARIEIHKHSCENANSYISYEKYEQSNNSNSFVLYCLIFMETARLVKIWNEHEMRLIFLHNFCSKHVSLQ